MDLVKRDENEIIVPILHEKSGVKKFKVLARQMVEDDEDIRKPESSERESPNTTEQTKENINTDKKLENKIVQKVTEIKSVKKSNFGSHTENKESGLKPVKQFKTLSSPCNKQLGNTKGNVEKILVKKKVVKKKVKLKQDAAKDAKVEGPSNKHAKNRNVDNSVKGKHASNELVKDRSAVKNVKGEHSKNELIKDRNLAKGGKDENPHKTECNKDRNVNIVNEKKAVSTKSVIPDIASKIVENCKTLEDTAKKAVSSVTKTEIDSSHIKTVKVECCVKLKRDPSIENLCKLNLDDSSGSSVDSNIHTNDLSDLSESSTGTKKKDASHISNSPENHTDARQSSYEENRQKTADMVFNANVQVRKSGRLQSAKCASRYRGDYGIRVDTYKQLVSKKELGTHSDGNSDESYNIMSNEIINEEAIDNERVMDMKSEVAAVVEECVLNASKSVEMNSIGRVRQCVNSSNICDCTPRRNSDCESGMDITENDRCMQMKICKTCNVDLFDKHKSDHMNCNIDCDICLNCENRTAKFEKKSHYCTSSESLTKSVPFTNTAGKDASACDCDKDLRHCSDVFRDKSDKVVFLNTVNNDTELLSQKKEAACGPDHLQGELIAKEFIAEKVLSLHSLEKDSDEQFSRYVHSVGKSVKRKRVEIKKSVNLPKPDPVPVLEPSPVKDPVAGLENLRLKLFEKAGANLIKADNVPKQFESALISSKRRTGKKSSEGEQINMVVNSDSECAVSKDDESLLHRSGKSICVDNNNQHILEEVAQSLDILKKVKRKAEPFKRQKFEDKQFMLRSMAKKQNNEEQTCTESDLTEMNAKEVIEKPAKLSAKCSSSRNSVDSVSSATSSESNVEINISKTSNDKKPAVKPKSVTCSACGHSFKSKDLMKKHFPCRVRQTRTWSQNKLRPNRAVKRIETCPKKFVCQLPKSGKGDANKNRPQLLTYRKTKFRRVKGKRRRKLYLLLQDLKHKRQLVKWPHLGVVYDDLSFKEQCLYKLGLYCIGHASEGLEQYTADDITLFEMHRAKQKLISQLTLDFQHSLLANSMENLTDDSKLTQSDPSDTSQSNVINSSQDIISTYAISTLTDSSSTSESLVNESAVDNKAMFSEAPETITDKSSEIQEQKEMHELSSCGLDGYEKVSSNKSRENDIAVINNEWKSTSVSDICMNSEVVEDDKLSDIKAIIKNEDKENKNESVENSPIPVNTDILSPENSQDGDFVSRTENECVNMEGTEHEQVEEESLSRCTTQSVDLSKEGLDNTEQQYITESGENNQGLPLNENVSIEVGSYEAKTVDDIDMVNDTESVNIVCVESGHYKVDSEDHKMLQNAELTTETDQSGFINDDEDVKCETTEADQNINSFKWPNHQEDELVLEKNVLEEIKCNQSVPCLKESPVKSEMMISINRKKSKYAVSLATDIEFFHQTASIDKDSLVADKYDDVDAAKTKQNSDINPDLIQHASELLQDILGDVEQTVNDGPRYTGNETKHDIKNTSTPIRSPLKSPGRDENIQALREIDLISPIKTNANVKETDKEEKISPSSGKKKIDFKTYASRKAMMRAKECEENEKEIHRNLCDSKDLNEDFLDRLIDAVSVIDSIIEEQKDYSIENGHRAGFSAITPELACELAATKSLQDYEITKDENKPYDIECLPYDEPNICDINEKVEIETNLYNHNSDTVISDEQDTVETGEVERVNGAHFTESHSTIEITNEENISEGNKTDETYKNESMSSEYLDDCQVSVDLVLCNQNESGTDDIGSSFSHLNEEQENHKDMGYLEISSVTESSTVDVLVEKVKTVSDSEENDKSIVTFENECNESFADFQDDLPNDSVKYDVENISNKSGDVDSFHAEDVLDDKSDNVCMLGENSVHDHPLHNTSNLVSKSDVSVSLSSEDILEDLSPNEEIKDNKGILEENSIDDNFVHDQDNMEDKLGDENSFHGDDELKGKLVDCDSEQNERFLDTPGTENILDGPCVEENSVDVDSIHDENSIDNITVGEESLQETERLEQQVFDEPSDCELALDNTTEGTCCMIEDLHNVISCGSSEISSTECAKKGNESDSDNATEIDSIVNNNTNLSVANSPSNESSDGQVNYETSESLVNENSSEVQHIVKDTTECMSFENVEPCDKSNLNEDLSDSLTDSNSTSNENLFSKSADAVKKISIKESNRDFTIKYEMNGLVIKENLLTGDKNVVENSSPFRSTSESRCTSERVSELESDTSLISKPGHDQSNPVLEASNDDSIACLVINSNSKIEPSNKQLELIHSSDLESHCKASDGIYNRIDIEKPVEVISVSEASVYEISSLNNESSISKLSDLNFDGNEIDLPDIDHRNDAQNHENGTDEKIVEKSDQENNSESDILATCDSEVENEPSTSFEVGINPDLSADKLSSWSPPTLEKVNECNISTDVSIEVPKIVASLSTEGSPPVLEPEDIDEQDMSDIGPDSPCVVSYENDSTKEFVPERHFLDALGNAFTEPDVSSGISTKLDNELLQVDDVKAEFTTVTMETELTNETEQIEDSIGRHFSDAIAEPVEESLSLQSLLDISENGEVTLAQIKQILSPVPNKSLNSHIPEQSLLKIKSSIANLLTKVKKPTKKDPSWLKRDFLTSYKPKHKMHEFEDSQDQDDNSNRYENDISEIAHNSDVEDTICINNAQYEESSSKGSVTDNILMMLTSLEDKGSLADNMTNLLDILAENLGFLSRKGTEKDDPNETSSKFCDPSRESIRTQKELLAEYLEEGDQPPPVDDIPMADDEFEFTMIKEKEELLSTNLSKCQCDNTCSSVVIPDSLDDTTDMFTKKDSIEHFSDQNFSNVESETSIKGTGNERIDVKCNKSGEKMVESDSSAKPKVKASTLFKSITELNSIETDEESNSGEIFDPISLSAGLSKLNDQSAWEFNSDYSSDGENEDTEECDAKPENAAGSKKSNEYEASYSSIDHVCKSEDSALELNVEECKDEDKKSLSCVESIYAVSPFSIMCSETKTKEVAQLCVKPTIELLNNDGESGDKGISRSNSITDFNVENDVVQGTNEDLNSTFEKNHNMLSTSTSPEICNTPPDNMDCLSNVTEKVDGHHGSERVAHDKSDCLESIDYTSSEDCDIAEVTGLKDMFKVKLFNYNIAPEIEEENSLLSSVKLPELQSQSFQFSVEDSKIDENIFLNDENEDTSSTQAFEEQDDTDNYTSDSESQLNVATELKDNINNAIENDQESNGIVDLNEEKSNHGAELNDKKLNPLAELHDDGGSNHEIDIKEPSHGVELNKEEASYRIGHEGNEINDKKNENRELVKSSDHIQRNSLECDDTSDLPGALGTSERPMTKDSSNNISFAVASTTEEQSVFDPLENDFSMTFCETIAEKVKRKQRGRCKSVCYSYNPLLYYSSAYAKELPKPAKKEFSVFRSSILEKRAREKYTGKEDTDDFDCSARKKRYSSVPKDMYSNEKNAVEKDTINNKKFGRLVDVKPCSVTLDRLSNDVIEKYANRKRKLVEEAKEEESRPPIKVTIKLSQIVYPPNSPYGSTSVSSCRSGYESDYSENSDYDEDSTITSDERNSSELSHSSENQPEASSVIDVDASDCKNSEDVIEREPLKIKMRTLLTKINDNINAIKSDTNTEKDLVAENETKTKSTSDSDSCESENQSCKVKMASEARTYVKETKTDSDEVLFYLSDDSPSENDSIKGQITEIVKKSMNEDNISTKDFVKDSVDHFIHGNCGESDVDLSASGSDSYMLGEINSILTANMNVHTQAKDDFSTIKEDIPNKKSDMKNIISDLKLSDSESDDDRFDPKSSATVLSSDNPYPVSGIIVASEENNVFEVIQNDDSVLETSREPIINRKNSNKTELTVDVNSESLLPEQNQCKNNACKCDNLSGMINSDRFQQYTKSQHNNKPDYCQFETSVENSIFRQELHKNVDDQLKGSDSDFAVKSLENESFQAIKDNMGEQSNEMIYYAVEVSDEFETHEAVENLESVELEQGELVGNECQSSLDIIDAVEARVLHSQVNDALELEETVNEEIVENCSEHKLIDSIEPQIHKADNDKQFETPVYYPTVSEVKSKYLYGINEDSQSSNEIVEELVMDTIETDTYSVEPVEQLEQSVVENNELDFMQVSDMVDYDDETRRTFNGPYLPSIPPDNMHGETDNVFTDIVNANFEEVSDPMFDYL